MKTKTITSKALIAFLAAALCVTISQSVSAITLSSSPQARSGFFILPAANSPSNILAQQNIMSYIDKGWVVGYIPTDVLEDPAALDRPNVWSVCQTIVTPFTSWNATNNPTGNFVNQYGSRIGWGYSLTSTNQFLASQVYFHFWSTDPANTMLYAGNLATNTANGLALTFSSTLRGERWNADGSTTVLTNGEDVDSNPINVLLALPRESYSAPDMTTVAQILNYFKDEMNLTNYAAFTMYDGSGNVIIGTTNQMSSRVYIDAPARSSADGKWYAQIEGQSQLGFTYYLLQTASLSHPVTWNTIAGGPEGSFNAGTNYPNSFFRAFESNGLAQAFSANIVSSGLPPAVQGSNGDE